MDENFQSILKEYIKQVDDICNLLLREINLSEKMELKNKYDFFEYRAKCRKMEFEFGGVIYKLHGKGCMAYKEGMFVDWDFGYRSRWCGIDPWKVAMTLKNSNSSYTNYYDGNLVKNLCEEMVYNGILYKKYEQYYFEVKFEDTFKPDFPTEYDTLIIEYGDSIWKVSRNKLIDRFIRKSARIQNEINSDLDKYTLKFSLAENIVYSISYNDIRFPDSAVKIMSDNIIKKLKM